MIQLQTIMTKPLDIRHEEELIARIYPSGLTTDNVVFYSSEEEPFQVGTHENKKGDILDPHVHEITKGDSLSITEVTELVYVQYGKIKVRLFTPSGEFISDHVLREHDSIVFSSGGHGVEFMEDSKIFMIKQGPFTYTKHSKIKI